MLGRVSTSARYGRVFVTLVVAMTCASFAVAGVARGDTTSTSSAFYLVIGASESVGLQPTVDNPRGERTTSGYANDVVASEAAQGVNLDLHQIGCSGETTGSMVNGGDGCYPAPDSQMNEALSFLQSHQGQHGLVTIDLGFNDVRTCLANLSTFSTCLTQKTALVHSQLTSILTALRSAAGPDVVFVGLNHNDPYLADALNGGGTRTARDSLVMVNRLNKTLHDVYTSFGVPVADVAAAFSVGDVSSAKVLKAGTLTQGSVVACELTWMCAPSPYGPNVHPNDAGYLAIADAIEDVLPPLT